MAIQTTVSIGDRIKFRVACREGMRTAERKVTGSYLGKPTVAFRGYRDFVVAWREIISVNGRSPDDAVVMLCKCTLPATGRCECVDGSARIFVEG